LAKIAIELADYIVVKLASCTAKVSTEFSKNFAKPVKARQQLEQSMECKQPQELAADSNCPSKSSKHFSFVKAVFIALLLSLKDLFSHQERL